jgi:O-antigen/teichoic acid export membrane protein
MLKIIRSKIISFFTQGHQRTLLAKRNIAASFFIKGCSVAVNLALVPLTINYINPTRYGIWLTLSSIIAWFSFFDIGFGNGLRNKFAEALALGQRELARIYVSTTYAILSVVITIVLLIFILINPFLNWSHILNTSTEMAGELSILALVIFVFFCIQFVLQLITTIITANQKPAMASLFNLLGGIISLTTQGNLLYLGIALGSSPALVLLVSSFWLYNGEYKEYSPSLKLVKFKFAKPLMGLGLKFFIIQGSAVFIYETTNIIITQILGPQSVTVYNIAYRYFSIAAMLCGIIASPLWSAYTEAYIKEDFIWMKNIIKKVNQFWLGMVLFITLLLVSSKYMYVLWIGHSVDVSWKISVLMALNMIAVVRFSLFIIIINGIGKIQLQLIINVLLSCVFIPISVFLCKCYGIVGVIIANFIVNMIFAIIAPIQTKRILNKTATGIWHK